MLSRLKMVMLVLAVVLMGTASLTSVQAETQIWVGELYGARVLVYNLDGTIAKTVNIGDMPNGIAQGPDGYVYVVGRNTHNIYRYSVGGVFISTFVTAGSEALIGIAFAPNGDLYATSDSGNVLVYDTAGVYKSTFVTFSGSFPTGITFSGGDAYIADYFNAKVNRYDSGGVGGAYMNTDFYPRQIAAGTDGKMYVAEYSAGINRFDISTGLVDPTWSVSGLAAGVSGVASVPDGNGGINIVVSTEGGTVNMYNGTDASLIKTFDATTDGNYRPYYIGVVDTDVKADTQIWVGELYGSRVLVYNLDGSLAKTVSIGDLPNGITQGPDGKVYVVGRNTHNIYSYSVGGIFESTFVTAGSEPLNGIAFAPNGDLYATSDSGSVLVYDTAGVYKSTFKTFSGSFPTGITFSGGDVYIANYLYSQVNRYDLAGVGGAYMNTDYYPHQISAGPDGKMYVAEYFAGINRFDISTGLVDSTWSVSGLADGVSGVAAVPDGIGGINIVVSTQGGAIKMFNGTNASLIRTFDATIDGNYRPYYIGVVDTTLSLSGTVNLLDFGGDKTTVTGTVELNGTSYPLVLDADGKFTILGVADGTYDVRIKASHWLAKMTPGVVVTGATIMDMVSLINGDVVDNNEVDFSDINATRAAYGSFPGDETWNEMADVDGTGEVDFTDINIVRSNYGEIGD